MHWVKHLWSGGLECMSSAVAAGDLYSASEEWGWSSYRDFALWPLLSLEQKDSMALDFFVQFPFQVLVYCNFLEKHLYFSTKIQKYVSEITSQRSMPDREFWLGWLLVFQWNLIICPRQFLSQRQLGFWDAALVFVRMIFGWAPVPLLVICCALAYGLLFFLSFLPYCLILSCLFPSRSMRLPKLMLEQAALCIATPFKGEIVPWKYF